MTWDDWFHHQTFLLQLTIYYSIQLQYMYSCDEPAVPTVIV